MTENPPPKMYAVWYSHGFAEDAVDGTSPFLEFCIVGMDGSVWVDDDRLARIRASLEEKKQESGQYAAYAFQLLTLSLALESGKLHRVSREEAEAIALVWGARRPVALAVSPA